MLHTADAKAVVGWCGFADDRNNRNNTGDWLMEVLIRLASQRPALRLPDLMNELVSNATGHFQSINEPPDDKACSIIMAGWASPRPDLAVPFAARVSNCENEMWLRLRHTKPTFDQQWLWPSQKRATKHPGVVLFSGTRQATTTEQGNALLMLLRRDPTPTEVMNVCLRIMREAASHTTYGNLIGRNYMGVEMRLDNHQTQAHYFPEHDSPQQFMPNLVSPAQAVKDARIWVGPGKPPWWTH